MSILDWFGFGKGKKKRRRLPPPKLARTKTDNYIKMMPEAYRLMAGKSAQGFIPVLSRIRALAEQPDWNGRFYNEALWHVELGGYDGSPFNGKDLNAVALVFLAAAYETQMWQLPKVMTVREIDRLVAYLGPNWPAEKPKQVRQPATLTKKVDRTYKKSAAFKEENTRIVPPVELEDEPVRKPWELKDDYRRFGGVWSNLLTFRTFVIVALLGAAAAVVYSLSSGAFAPLDWLAAAWAFLKEHWLEILIFLLIAALIAWLLRKFFKGRKQSKDAKNAQQQQSGQQGQSDSQQDEKPEDKPEDSQKGDDEDQQKSDGEDQKMDVDDVVKMDDSEPEKSDSKKTADEQATEEEDKPEQDDQAEQQSASSATEDDPSEEQKEKTEATEANAAQKAEEDEEADAKAATMADEDDENAESAREAEEGEEPDAVVVEEQEVLVEEEDAEQAETSENEDAEETKAEEIPEPEKTQAEVDKELRAKLRELLKELDLEELDKNEEGAIEDAIERAEQLLAESEKKAKDETIRSSTYKHGGVHASLEHLDARIGHVEPKLANEIELRLNKVLSVMDLCGEELSRRLDGEKLTKEMAARRINLSRIRREELQVGTKLLMVDVSGSCESVARYALAAAAAILRRDNRCVLVVHSNGIPEQVYGALENVLPSVARCNNGYEVADWWAEVIRSLNAVATLSGAVNWGDWDAGFIMQQLCESKTAVVWFDHYRSGNVSPACAQLRANAKGWSQQPVAWFEGVQDAQTTAIALRLADKEMRNRLNKK